VDVFTGGDTLTFTISDKLQPNTLAKCLLLKVKIKNGELVNNCRLWSFPYCLKYVSTYTDTTSILAS